MRKKAAGSRQDSGQDAVLCLPPPALRRVLTTAVLLAAGCQLLNPSNYFPLGFGFRWSYRATITYTFPGGMMTGWTDSIETRVLGVFDTADQSGWKVETRSIHARFETAYYAQATDRLLAGGSPTDPNPVLVMALPLTEGSTWVRESTARAGRVTMRVEGRDSMRVVDDTTGDIWRVKLTCQLLPESAITFWFMTIRSTHHDGLSQIAAFR